MPESRNPYIPMMPLAFLAALLATFCDAIHAHTGTLAYPDPWLFKQAFWVFPLFFISFISMAAGYFLITKRLPAAIAADQSTAPGDFQNSGSVHQRDPFGQPESFLEFRLRPPAGSIRSTGVIP